MDIRDFRWTREPARWSLTEDRASITTSPHTDLWQRTYYHFRNDNAPVLQVETDCIRIKTGGKEKTISFSDIRGIDYPHRWNFFL